MKKLYDEIKKRFPEVSLYEEDMDLSYLMMHEIKYWLESEEVNCEDRKIIDRIVGFQNWCYEQESGSDAANDISTIYTVGLFEKIFEDKKTYIIVPHLTTHKELIKNKNYLIRWCGRKAYERVLKLMRN